MEAIANNPKFAKKVGVSQSVGKDFSEADKGKKFSSGGQNSAQLQAINKKKTNHGATALFKEGGMASSGAKIQKEMNKQLPKGISKQGIMPESKSMGMLGMKKGGMTMKAKKFDTGGMAERGYRTSREQTAYDNAIESRKNTEQALNDRKQAKTDLAYERAAKQYSKEKQFGDTDASMRKFYRDNLVTPIQKFSAEKLGNEFDAGDLKARKDILNYKKGGKAEARMMPAKMEKVNDTMSAKKGGANMDKPMGSAKMGKVPQMSFAKGGMTRGDGIASKGKTKGKVC